MSGWLKYPNLKLRPHAPAKGRGAVQVQIRRAFVACGPLVTTSQVYAWCYPHKRRVGRHCRYRVWANLMAVAVPVGRAKTIGRPWIWKLPD